MQKAGQTLRELDRKVRAATLSALENASDDLQSSGRDVTRQWKHKVEFKETPTIDRLRMELLILPVGNNKRIFNYVDMGTKGPYLILPKKPGGSLFFRTGYSARTAPIAKYNQGSGQSFGSLVKSKGVIHPGIVARKFLFTFMTQLAPSLQNRVQLSINIGI